MRILLADDHEIIREGLKKILLKELGTATIDEASDGNKALEKIKVNRYDVVLLDISMPGKDGFEVLIQLKNIKANPSIIILSIYPEDQFALRALRLGASGYLMKDTAPQELSRAIHKVINGGKYVSAAVAENVVSEIGADDLKPLHEKLSSREYQVMLMLVSGRNMSDICGQLCLSESTVSTYRHRILKKMNMTNNVQLTRYAIRNKLLTL